MQPRPSNLKRHPPALLTCLACEVIRSGIKAVHGPSFQEDRAAGSGRSANQWSRKFGSASRRFSFPAAEKPGSTFEACRIFICHHRRDMKLSHVRAAVQKAGDKFLCRRQSWIGCVRALWSCTCTPSGRAATGLSRPLSPNLLRFAKAPRDLKLVVQPWASCGLGLITSYHVQEPLFSAGAECVPVNLLGLSGRNFLKSQQQLG